MAVVAVESADASGRNAADAMRCDAAPSKRISHAVITTRSLRAAAQHSACRSEPSQHARRPSSPTAADTVYVSITVLRRGAARCRGLTDASPRWTGAESAIANSGAKQSDAAGIALGAGRQCHAVPPPAQARPARAMAGRGPRNPRLRRPTLSGDPSRRQGINTGYAGRGGA